MNANTGQPSASPPSYREALERVLDAVMPLGKRVTVPLADAFGRVLADEVVSDRDLPPFNRASLDGYAFRAAEFAPGRAMPVVGAVPAGSAGNINVPPGACVAIATGAPVPAGLDTVIQHERSDRANPVSFTVDSITAGHAVHPQGADAKCGDIVLPRGTRLAAHHLGIAASVGKTTLEVAAAPHVAILTSGDEIIRPDAQPQRHQVRNSNAPMLAAIVSRMGGCVASAAHLPDELEHVRAAVVSQLASCDVLITVGGISAGERDHFRAAFDAAGVRPVVTRAKIQPGGPIFVGVHERGKVIVGLPGNPVSVLACACLFLWPVMRQLLGLDAALPWRHVTLAEAVKPNSTRQAFRPAALLANNQARVPSWAGSGDLVHTACTDGLLELPMQTDDVAAGTSLRFLPWP